MLKPGNYILPHDIVNPRPDRRKTLDWRAFPTWAKGWEFLAQDQANDGGSPYTRLVLVGHRWTSMAVGPGHEEQYAALEAALVPCEESMDAMFTALAVNDYFARWLVETERLDRETFKRLWKEYEAS